MRGDFLPNDDNVVHYVRPGLIEDREVDGGAFVLREGESALSVNWLDYFKNRSKEQQLREVRRLFRLRVRSNGRFAELNVGQTKLFLIDKIQDLRFVENPLPEDPINGYDADNSHALIEGLPNPNDLPEYAKLVGDMIAECVLKPLHPAIEE
jgi:hypothetical protein